MTRWTRRAVVAIMAVAALAVAVVTGCAPTGDRPADGPFAAASSSVATPDGEDATVPSAAPTDVAAGATDDAPIGAADRPGAQPLSEARTGAGRGPRPIPAADVVPVAVRIPQIGVDSALEDLIRSDDGVLQPPVEPETAGWFTEGTVPGDRGPAVIAGHVDSGVAGAVFQDLDELGRGDEIAVEMSDGTVRTFAVTSSAVVPQARFPTEAVYGPVPDRQLRLITCHTFDPDDRDYVDNLVVFAVAVD